MSTRLLKMGLATILSLVILAGSHTNAVCQSVIKCAGQDISQGKMHTTARLFMKTNPGTRVDLAKTPTVDAGIKSVMDGKADLAISCRQINQTEKDMASQRELALSEKLIGRGPIVLVTHSSNPVNALTVDQVKGILTGTYSNWNQLGGSDQSIALFVPDTTHHGIIGFLQEQLLFGSGLTHRACAVSSFQEILKEVSMRPGALGCVRIKAIEMPRPADETFRILAVKKTPEAEAVMPSRENAGNGTYPLSRPYYAYYNATASDAVKNFVDLVVAKGTGPGF